MRTSAQTMTYKSTTESDFRRIHLITSLLDATFTIWPKHQKNAETTKIGIFQPFFATHKGPEAQKQGQIPPQIPPIYIFTKDTVQLDKGTSRPTSRQSQPKSMSIFRTAFTPPPNQSSKRQPNPNAQHTLHYSPKTITRKTNRTIHHSPTQPVAMKIPTPQAQTLHHPTRPYYASTLRPISAQHAKTKKPGARRPPYRRILHAPG